MDCRPPDAMRSLLIFCEPSVSQSLISRNPSRVASTLSNPRTVGFFYISGFSPEILYQCGRAAFEPVQGRDNMPEMFTNGH
jgi:hypothetical protein